MKKKYLFIILIIFVLIFFNIFLKDISSFNQFDDIIFIKLFSNFNKDNSISKNKKEIKYEFNIQYKNTKLKDINLVNTAVPKTLVNEKVAPGTEGSFSIVLKSNKKSNYNVQFVSENKKPQNLKFKALLDENHISEERSSLDELSEIVNGVIFEHEIKVIKIMWKWEYESKDNLEEIDLQDTKDSNNIKQYRFEINVQGKEI